MKRTIHQLIAHAHKFADAQSQIAAQAKEDSQHWHHVAVADLLREMASALSSTLRETPL